MDNRRRMMLAGGVSADPVLENNDWATISKIARAGKAAEFWNVGDLKNISIGGVTYAAQIIGFNHDDITDPAAYGRAKAGITFQLQNCYANKMPMNRDSVATRYGGWSTCDLRNTLKNTIFPTLETALKNTIATVNKPYDYDKQLLISADELFLLSTTEVRNSGPFGSQYAYYAAGNSQIKKIGTTNVTWWLRIHSDINFSAIFDTGQYGIAQANTSLGVAFAFCV